MVAVWHDPETKALPLVAGALVLTGTLFYWRFEDWTVIQALYFSVVTLTTVGYGDFTPTTTGTQIFTIIYILTGLGILVAPTRASRCTTTPPQVARGSLCRGGRERAAAAVRAPPPKSRQEPRRTSMLIAVGCPRHGRSPNAQRRETLASSGDGGLVWSSRVVVE